MNKKLLAISIMFLIFGLFVDQYTKYLAVNNLDFTSNIEIIKDFFYLTLVYNFGAAFGSFQGFGFVFIASAIVMIIILFSHLYFNKKNKNLYLLPTFIFTAGIIGNLIDRIRIGKVIDFLNFYIFSYNFPVFNLADVFITIGAAYLVVVVLIEERKNKNEKKLKSE